MYHIPPLNLINLMCCVPDRLRRFPTNMACVSAQTLSVQMSLLSVKSPPPYKWTFSLELHLPTSLVGQQKSPYQATQDGVSMVKTAFLKTG